MRVHTLETSDPQWATHLAGTRHDVFHTPGFVRAEDLFRGTRTRLVVVEDGAHTLAVPLVFAAVAGGLEDAASPHGPAGPVFTEGSSPQWRAAAVRELVAHLRERGVVCLFLRAHPLLGLEEFAEVGAVVEHGPSYVIPLDRPLEEIRAGMRQNHRRNMRKAERDGHVARQDHEWAHLDDFHRIYTRTMERVGASGAYLYTREHVERLRDDPGTGASLWVLRMDGELAGAHLVTACNGTVQYFLGATHPDFHRRVPQVAIFHAVLTWAHEGGERDYHLGGGLQESLRHFKSGFTKIERAEATARILVRPEEYARLCDEWEVEHGRLTRSPEAFFPGYRTPVETAASLVGAG